MRPKKWKMWKWIDAPLSEYTREPESRRTLDGILTLNTVIFSLGSLEQKGKVHFCVPLSR